MKVLVTGGTGVVGEGIVRGLLERGMEVRILSRRAAEAVGQWPRGVEARPGDVASRAEVTGAAEGCDAIVHAAGIVAERPPDETFERVNVEGTRHVVREAERAKVSRLVFVSSLGAHRGTSDYHRSKARAEEIVRRGTRPWVILRPGSVYGPGDHALSVLLKMVRTLPAVPLVEDGRQRLQPIWYEDLGRAVARAIDADGVVGRVLDVAGPEQVTMAELLDRMSALTGRRPARIRVPAPLAELGVQVATLLGLPIPTSQGQLTMLLEENVIPDAGENALAAVLGVKPTGLDDGLARLDEALPEQTPEQGVGSLGHRRYWADIHKSFFRAGALRDVFRRRAAEVMPLETGGDGARTHNLKKNQAFFLALPGRGPLGLRVEEITPSRITAVTLEGHPLAGTVTFDFIERGPEVRFEVGVYARAANVVDAALMAAVGSFLQDLNWMAVVERVVALSGGTAPAGVQTESKDLDDEEAERIGAWTAGLVTRRKREQAPVPGVARGRTTRTRKRRPIPARPAAAPARVPAARRRSATVSAPSRPRTPKGHSPKGRSRTHPTPTGRGR